MMLYSFARVSAVLGMRRQAGLFRAGEPRVASRPASHLDTPDTPPKRPPAANAKPRTDPAVFLFEGDGGRPVRAPRPEPLLRSSGVGT